MQNIAKTKKSSTVTTGSPVTKNPVLASAKVFIGVIVVIALIAISVLSVIELVERKKVASCVSREMGISFRATATAHFDKSSLVLNYIRNNAHEMDFKLYNYNRIKGFTIEGKAKDTTISTGVTKFIEMHSQWDLKYVTPLIAKEANRVAYSAINNNSFLHTIDSFTHSNPVTEVYPQPKSNQLEIVISNLPFQSVVTLDVHFVIKNNAPHLVLKNQRVQALGFFQLPPDMVREIMQGMQPISSESMAPHIPRGFTLQKVWINNHSVDTFLTAKNYTLTVPDPKDPHKRITIIKACTF